MILRFRNSDPHLGPPVEARGGAGQGITTTALATTSYGDGPPSSTVTAYRGLKSGPEIAGSVGGFIGLISGVAVAVVLGVFVGVYLWNRHRRRLPLKGVRAHIPTNSFSHRSTDPYDLPLPSVDTSDQYLPRRHTSKDHGFPPSINQGRFGFGKSGYTRQSSSEWELQLGDITKGKGKNTTRDAPGTEDELPLEVDEATVPLRIPPPSSPDIHTRAISGMTTADRYDRDRGMLVSDVTENQTSRRSAGENPFDDVDETVFKTNKRHQFEQGSQTGDGRLYNRAQQGEEDDIETSDGSSDSRVDVRVESVRPGSRFVEGFGSQET